jgi:hypothetical protein
VEIGVAGGGSATIVSLADGTTSMYTSGGGGVIGAGQHKGPADASRRFLAVLQANLDLLPGAGACPLPEAETVAFVVLTYDGIRRLEVSERQLAHPPRPRLSVVDRGQRSHRGDPLPVGDAGLIGGRPKPGGPQARRPDGTIPRHSGESRLRWLAIP